MPLTLQKPPPEYVHMGLEASLCRRRPSRLPPAHQNYLQPGDLSQAKTNDATFSSVWTIDRAREIEGPLS